MPRDSILRLRRPRTRPHLDRARRCPRESIRSDRVGRTFKCRGETRRLCIAGSVPALTTTEHWTRRRRSWRSAATAVAKCYTPVQCSRRCELSQPTPQTFEPEHLEEPSREASEQCPAKVRFGDPMLPTRQERVPLRDSSAPGDAIEDRSQPCSFDSIYLADPSNAPEQMRAEVGMSVTVL